MVFVAWLAAMPLVLSAQSFTIRGRFIDVASDTFMTRQLTIPGAKYYRHPFTIYKDKIIKSLQSNHWCKSICHKWFNSQQTGPDIPEKRTTTWGLPHDRGAITTRGPMQNKPVTWQTEWRTRSRRSQRAMHIRKLAIRQNENRVAAIYNAVSVRSEAKLTIRWLYDTYDILPCWIVEYKDYCKVKIHWKIELFIPVRPYLRPPNLKSVYISSIGLLLVFLRKR